MMFIFTCCEGFCLCPLSPEPPTDGAADPGGVIRVGKQMLQLGFADAPHAVSALQLLQMKKTKCTRMSSFPLSCVIIIVK